jgi:hypothetical protein
MNVRKRFGQQFVKPGTHDLHDDRLAQRLGFDRREFARRLVARIKLCG